MLIPPKRNHRTINLPGTSDTLVFSECDQPGEGYPINEARNKVRLDTQGGQTDSDTRYQTQFFANSRNNNHNYARTAKEIYP